MSDRPKVSVVCLAYNQEKYIRQALDGFVMQKTNFPFEVVIHDDASTDKTAQIIKEYQQKYPHLIRPIFQTKNQFSLGKNILVDFMLDHIHGEYVAMNEGDDYWTDENKLQRQVDFLEAHPDYNICFHPVRVVWEDNAEPESIFPTPQFRFHKATLTLEDLLKHNFIQTNSVMYRWKLTAQNWPRKDFLPWDYMWSLIHAKDGKIGFLPYVMAVYRRNAGGIWTGSGQSEEWFLKRGLQYMRFYQVLQEVFSVDSQKNILTIGKRLISVALKHRRWDILESLSQEFKDQWAALSENQAEKIWDKKRRALKRKVKIFQFVAAGLFLIVLLLLIRGGFK